MRKWILLAGIGLLAACDGGGRDEARLQAEMAPAMEMAEADAVAVSSARMAPKADMATGGANSDGEPVDASVPRQLAYEYDASLRLPAENVAAMIAAHEARCNEAGPRVCQVISSSVAEQNENYVYGSLEIRAAKDFMDNFREGLAGDAEDAKGSLVSMNSRAEDLTRQITDTEARLNAQKTLRDRLLRLLERETDEVGDLLQIERELARVQSEIESAESWLRVLRARVAMDRLTLNYQSIPKAVTPQTAQPLRDAFTNFFADLAWSLAAVISFIAHMIPWLIVIAPGLWLLRAVWRNWRKKR
ncbi:DUF4349 domain-containing protein [Parvularcula marina]|nr:DUF4349 domain-containing protein [Parvularcula marina]